MNQSIGNIGRLQSHDPVHTKLNNRPKQDNFNNNKDIKSSDHFTSNTAKVFKLKSPLSSNNGSSRDIHLSNGNIFRLYLDTGQYEVLDKDNKVLREDNLGIGEIRYFDQNSGGIESKEGVAAIDKDIGEIKYAIPDVGIGEIQYFDPKDNSVQSKEGVAVIDENTCEIIRLKNPEVLFISGYYDLLDDKRVVVTQNNGTFLVKKDGTILEDNYNNIDSKTRDKLNHLNITNIDGYINKTSEYPNHIVKMRSLYATAVKKCDLSALKQLLAKPLTIVIHSKYDNSFNALSTANVEDFQKQNNVLHFEASKDNEIKDILNDLTKLQTLAKGNNQALKINNFVIVGHGSPTELSLGTSFTEESDLDTGDSDILNIRYADLFKGSNIILTSCLNGEGREENPTNLANTVSRTLGAKAHKIYSYPNSNTYKYVFNEAWDFTGLKSIQDDIEPYVITK